MFFTRFSYESFVMPSQIMLSIVANNVSLNGGYQRPFCSARPCRIIVAPSVVWRLCTFGFLLNPENSYRFYFYFTHSRVAEHKYDKFQPLRTNLRKNTEPQGLKRLLLVIRLNHPHCSTGCFLLHRFSQCRGLWHLLLLSASVGKGFRNLFFLLIFFSVCVWLWMICEAERR